VLTFVAAGFVGMALAGAIGQANSLVAAIWGVFVWREFSGASRRSKVWLTLMFLFYVSGIVSIAFSHEEKSAPARFEMTRETTTAGRPVDLIVLRDLTGGLEAAIAPAEGGELSGFRVKHRNRWNELIYRARDYAETQGWRGKAPFLWPATGRNFAPGVRPDAALDAIGAYDMGGRRYPMPLHGFARQMAWTAMEQTAGPGEASATLLLTDSPETRRYYPFGFRVTAQYRLRDGELGLLYTVTASRQNTGPMWFSIGNHMILNMPFVPESDVRAMTLETPSTVELLKTTEGLPTGESRPRSVSPAVGLAGFDTRTAVSLGGYKGNPWLRLSDPAGLSLTISHEASSLPAGPLVQFNLWGEPLKGFFSPEPWVGLQNSLVLRQGLVSLDAGASWSWRVVLRPEHN
jgi:galactose mutarotase-like enzyme